MFISTYPLCMRNLMTIMKHPNATEELVALGFEILNILGKSDSFELAFS